MSKFFANLKRDPSEQIPPAQKAEGILAQAGARPTGHQLVLAAAFCLSAALEAKVAPLTGQEVFDLLVTLNLRKY